MEVTGWYSRGYLPHIDCGRTQFLTWRLADSVPTEVIEQWKLELAALEEKPRWMEIDARIERYCDAGHGSCILKEPWLAHIVQETLIFDHGRRFELHAWAVMPNHVHILLSPNEGIHLKDIAKLLKGVSARRINVARSQKGQIWQEDYFDRFIRDGNHFAGVRHYIHWNPVKAKLCNDPNHWPWSSANPGALARLEAVSMNRT